MSAPATALSPSRSEDGTLRVSEVFGPTIQGEGPLAGHVAHFIRLMGCNLSCSWCVESGMLILRPDFTWTPAGDLQVGDKVLGRSAPDNGKHGKLVESTITNLVRRDAPLRRVNGNLVVAEGTRFWASRNRAVRSGWREIERCEGLACTFLAEPGKRDEQAYRLGYLAGISDGDGTWWTLRKGDQRYRRFRLALNDQALLDRTQEYAASLGYTLRPGVHDHTGFTGAGRMSALWLTDSVAAELLERRLADTPDDESWAWGYLGGIFDAEGHLTAGGVIRISQSPEANGPTYERIARAAESLGFDVAREAKALRLRGRGGELWRFLTGATPAKASSLAHGLDRAPNNARTIETVEDAGHGEVVSMTTSTGNYIAEGWLVHNCDTPYTWDSTRYDLRAETKLVAPADLARQLAGARLVVLTGGEPLLQLRTGGALHDLLVLLDGERCAVQVETNGTIAPPLWAMDLVDTWVVSPKLPNAGEHRGHQDRALAKDWPAIARGHNAHAKVVCVDPSDVLRVARWAERVRWPRDRVWVMPEGTTAADLSETFPLVATAAAELGVNVSHRLHTLAWGQERGR